MNSVRRHSNPKRRIRGNVPTELLERLGRTIAYAGNAAHKRNPGDFGLTPPAAPRPDKTLCDVVDVFQRQDAIRLLREGVARGLISEQMRGEYPQNIWSVLDGQPLEAQLENQDRGTYHGYPMAQSDPFREVVLEAWHRHEQ